MRTKTLLLSAAAMAAGLASAVAQSNVYSANVVGYASVVLHGNGQYSLISNPFDDGNGNYLTNLLNQALPKQSQVLTFDPTLGYVTVQKVGTPANWPAGTTNQLFAGNGFFVRNGGVGSGAPDLTNTFVGSIIVANGNSVTNNLGIGYSLQASPIPYSGNVATVGQNGGDTNMDFGGPLTRQSQILTWDPVAGFVGVQKVGSPTATWNGTATVNVGDGFFVFNKNGPVTNAVETLNLQ